MIQFIQMTPTFQEEDRRVVQDNLRNLQELEDTHVLVVHNQEPKDIQVRQHSLEAGHNPEDVHSSEEVQRSLELHQRKP